MDDLLDVQLFLANTRCGSGATTWFFVVTNGMVRAAVSFEDIGSSYWRWS
jgi:hypothetical protein